VPNYQEALLTTTFKGPRLDNPRKTGVDFWHTFCQAWAGGKIIYKSLAWNLHAASTEILYPTLQVSIKNTENNT